jgi:glycosyltransferase involved in cell wall biosynthesis
VSPKVSVVVPTYCPGDRLDALVRSLDAQTMLAADFEVIFVDDGSPDDTWRRLQQIRDSHGNVRLERIEHAMIDRLVHHAEVVSLRGDSYRLKDRDLGRPTNAANGDQ